MNNKAENQNFHATPETIDASLARLQALQWERIERHAKDWIDIALAVGIVARQIRLEVRYQWESGGPKISAVLYQDEPVWWLLSPEQLAEIRRELIERHAPDVKGE